MDELISYYALAAVLHPIIDGRPPVIKRVPDQLVHEMRRLRLIHYPLRGEQPFLHGSDSVLPQLKALQVLLPQHHHLNQYHQLVGMLLQCHESPITLIILYIMVLLFHEVSELFEFLGRISAQYIDKFLGHLEWRLLELESLARRIGQEKPIVNVDNVALRVHHDILIMPVLYL